MRLISNYPKLTTRAIQISVGHFDVHINSPVWYMEMRRIRKGTKFFDLLSPLLLFPSLQLTLSRLPP